MDYGNKTISGSLLFIGSVVYLLGTVVGEKFGNTIVFNAAVVLLGLLMLVSVYFIQRAFKSTLFSAILALAGIGTIGVGLLTFGSTEYYVFADIGYIFFALSAIMSYKYEKAPLSYLSVILGVGSLLAFLLWVASVDLGSGMKVTPIIIDTLILLWLTGFGAHIINKTD
jgi:hypothetical protein